MQNPENHHFISALGVAGTAFTVFNFSGLPFFQNTDNFVLFAQEEIKLEQGVQVSGGDIGSNGKIDIEKDIINGNIFADIISIDKNTLINGNASFNKLKTKKETQILGTQTKPIQLPIVHLPEIPEFQVGTQDFKFEGTANTLIAGSYRNITLEKSSRLILTGGIYNLNKLELKENSMLIFNASTTLNIQFKLQGKDRTSILPGQNLKPGNLTINHQGKKEKEDRDDNDKDNNKNKNENKDEGGVQPIEFGKNSFLNFKLVASKASVHIEKESTIRGQVLARKIKIGKEGIVSMEEVFVKESDPAKVVEDQEVRFIVNEIVILLTNDATISDAQTIASSVNGMLTCFVPNPPTYKVEVFASTPAELFALITQMKNSGNPKLIEAVPNLLSEQ
ncbi:MAG: hypothetical protein AAB362_00480 [Patescibacteria group bacterium]